MTRFTSSAPGGPKPQHAFESVSRLWLEFALDHTVARNLGKVPVIVEGPQLVPGFAVSFLPDQVPGTVPGMSTRLIGQV